MFSKVPILLGQAVFDIDTIRAMAATIAWGMISYNVLSHKRVFWRRTDATCMANAKAIVIATGIEHLVSDFMDYKSGHDYWSRSTIRERRAAVRKYRAYARRIEATFTTANTLWYIAISIRRVSTPQY